jgi:hypothetical protein
VAIIPEVLSKSRSTTLLDCDFNNGHIIFKDESTAGFDKIMPYINELFLILRVGVVGGKTSGIKILFCCRNC